MGISRDSIHKRRASSGKRCPIRKKRKFEMGRPPALTKVGAKRIHDVRCRGGFIKHRALRLESGNYSWGSEVVTRKTRILQVVYNSSNNELVRTNTLVKNAIIQIDATPFRQWFKAHYGADVVTAKKVADKKDAATTAAAASTPAPVEAAPAKEGEAAAQDVKQSKKVQKKLAKRQGAVKIDPHLIEQFNAGRLYACISSRPGQSGRADGYILEGPELEFYLRKLHIKKKK